MVMQLAMRRAAKAQEEEAENARKSRESSPISGGSISPVGRALSPGVGLVVGSPMGLERGGQGEVGGAGGGGGSAAQTPNGGRVGREWALDPAGIPPGQTFV